MSNELICPICGEATYTIYGNPRKDRLCRKHGKMLHNGEIAVDEAGIFIDVKTKKVLNRDYKAQGSETKCVICGENSNGKDICKSCYVEVINVQKDLDKNKKPWELKDYYYNLKAFIGRLKDYQEATQNLYKLYAIAWLLKKIYDDDQLINVVTSDVTFLLKGINKIKGLKINEQQQQNAKTIIAVDRKSVV